MYLASKGHLVGDANGEQLLVNALECGSAGMVVASLRSSLRKAAQPSRAVALVSASFKCTVSIE